MGKVSHSSGYHLPVLRWTKQKEMVTLREVNWDGKSKKRR